MIDRRLVSQTLLYTTVGGLAGLLVCAVLIWLVGGMWHPDDDFIRPAMIWGLKSQTIFLYYGIFGLLVGFVVTLIEPVNDSSWKEAFTASGRWLLLGALFGYIGMIVGGFAGEWVFDRMVTTGSYGMTILGQEIGLLLLGLALGSGIGFVDRLRTGSMDRLVAGSIGGCLGGVLAGAFILLPFVPPELMPILPTILVAMFAAGAIGSVSMMKTDAVLTGMAGNTIFKYSSPNWRKQLVSDSPNFIGSGIPGRRSRQARFLVANDLDVVSEHAIIEFDRRARRWVLRRWSSDAVKLFLNNRALTGDFVTLRDGDVVTFGGTRFRFVLTK